MDRNQDDHVELESFIFGCIVAVAVCAFFFGLFIIPLTKPAPFGRIVDVATFSTQVNKQAGQGLNLEKPKCVFRVESQVGRFSTLSLPAGECVATDRINVPPGTMIRIADVRGGRVVKYAYYNPANPDSTP